MVPTSQVPSHLSGLALPIVEAAVVTGGTNPFLGAPPGFEGRGAQSERGVTLGVTTVARCPHGMNPCLLEAAMSAERLLITGRV